MKNTAKRILSCILVLLTVSGTILGCTQKETGDASVPVKYDYDLNDYVRLEGYMGIPVKDVSAIVTEEEMEANILLARSNYSSLVEVDRGAEMCDLLTIDYEGEMNGEILEEATDTDADLVIGADAFFDGFEEGLIGAVAGETRVLDLSFPDPYMEALEYSGEAIRFTVTVHKVYEQILPEYSDEFVSEYYGYDSIPDFEAALHAAIKEQKTKDREYYINSQIWNYLMDNSEILNYPAKEYQAEYDAYIDYYTDAAAQQGMTLETFVQETLEVSLSEFYAWVTDEVETIVKNDMVMYYIARRENITLADEEYDTRAAELGRQYGFSTVTSLEENFGKEELWEYLLFDKVLETVVAAASFQ